MKTITIISVVLFLLAVTLMGIPLISNISGRMPAAREAGSEPTTTMPESDEGTGRPTTEDIDSKAITAIEIYLDGDKNNGLLLGEADYPIESPEAASIYGDAYLKSGYRLLWENTGGLAFEPGSVHYVYVYAYIPKYGWQYIREKFSLPGELPVSDAVFLYIDGPKEGETVSGQFGINGWSADGTVVENPGISSIEVTLNGPRDFGRFLGNASLGVARPDVVDVLANENYLFSGYHFTFHASELEAGSLNTFYIYSFSTRGSYQLETIELRAEGIKSDHAVLSVESDLSEIVSSGTVEFKGWAVPKD